METDARARSGQTGSGKTYTMGSGSAESVVDEHELGIIPRATVHIFNLIQEKRERCPTAEFYLRAQFLEIYGETVRDLLDPAGTAAGKKVDIRDGQGDEVTVSGAREESIKSPADLLSCLDRGTLVRTTGATDMNAHSSRSHAIFTVILEQHLDAVDGDAEFRSAKFHFVDLAGSERVKRTGATGVRLQEGININKGLLALGNVISALGDASAKAKHVPYRNSKLTRMLQDSLGGNSRTLMIACVSAADVNFEETLNALRYANRARNIQNRAVVNRDPATSQIVALKQQVAQLKQMLARGEFADAGSGADNRLSAAENEVARLTALLAHERKVRSDLEQQLSEATAAGPLFCGTAATPPAPPQELPDDVLHALLLAEPSSVCEDEDEDSAQLRRQYEASQHALRAMVNTYDQALQAKLEAVRLISEERARFEAMKAGYEAKMAELDAEVRETAKERNQLADKLKEVESLAQQTEATRQQQAKLRSMVADKDKRLRELEDRSRQLEDARKAVAEWQRKEALVRQEIEHTRRDKVEATRRLAENAKRFAEELKAHRSEIAHLLRDKARLAQDASQMSLRSERDAKLLAQKSEQVAVRSSRALSLSLARSVSPPPNGGNGTHPAKRQAMQRKLREAQRLTALPAQLADRAKAQRVQLERMAAEQVRREEELADLRRALAKKEEAIVRRDALLAELERVRAAAAPSPVPPPMPLREAERLVVSVPQEASGEDVAAMEQRLEAAYCEIVFRDRQMEQLAGAGGTAAAAAAGEWMEIGSLEQASEVIAALMQLFVEAKQETRQLLQANAQLLREQAQPSLLLRASDAQPATPASQPTTPDAKPSAHAASQVRIRNIEERLRAMQVDKSPRGAAHRRSGGVWERLTSPSGYTGIHKHNAHFLRKHAATASELPAEETVMDELVVVSDDDEDKQVRITAMFAEAQAGSASPKHAAAAAQHGWARVAAQSTESYTNKRALDAEARKRVKSPTQQRKPGKENAAKECVFRRG